MFLVLTGLEINLLKDKKYELLGEWIKECKSKDYWIKKKVKAITKKTDLIKRICHTLASSKDLTINPPQLKQKAPNKSKM